MSAVSVGGDDRSSVRSAQQQKPRYKALFASRTGGVLMIFALFLALSLGFYLYRLLRPQHFRSRGSVHRRRCRGVRSAHRARAVRRSQLSRSLRPEAGDQGDDLVPGSIGFVVGSAHGVARSIRHLLGRLRRRHHPERPRGATRRGADQSSPTSPQQQGQILKRPNMKEKFAEHLKSELGYEFTDEIDAFGRQT